MSLHRSVQFRWFSSLWSIGWNCWWKKTPVTSLDPLKIVPLCLKLVSSPSLQGSADTTCVPKHQRDFVLEIYLCEHTSYSGHRIELCWLAHSRWVQCEFRMRICGALSLSLSHRIFIDDSINRTDHFSFKISWAAKVLRSAGENECLFVWNNPDNDDAECWQLFQEALLNALKYHVENVTFVYEKMVHGWGGAEMVGNYTRKISISE